MRSISINLLDEALQRKFIHIYNFEDKFDIRLECAVVLIGEIYKKLKESN